LHILVRGLIGQNWKVNDDNFFTEYVNLLKWTKGFDSKGFDSKGFDSKGFDSKGFKDENVKVETLNQNGIRGP
jgi:hypothetical protein